MIVKIINFLLFVAKLITVATITWIIFGVGFYLVKAEIVTFKFEWLKNVYYTGIGILNVFAVQVIVKNMADPINYKDLW